METNLMNTTSVLAPVSRAWWLWIFRLAAALLMLQSLFFKFSGAAESIYIFSTLGIEPWGRIGTGVMELIASLLILIPRTSGIGAVLGAGVMSGAIVSHLTKLGIVVQDDGGLLFIYAVIVFVSCAVVAAAYRKMLIGLIKLNF
jgi:uncharacterized membrane protein YphA (DoxX/SURF4 family)